MRISVVTVCFNSAATIADACRSVAVQRHAEVEHLVIDGGSSDATVALANAAARPGARVSSAPDRGIYDAMNKGIRQATGEVVGFLNGDDLLEDASVLDRVAKAFADPSVECAYGDLVYVRQDDTAAVVRRWRANWYRPSLSRCCLAPPHPTFYARRSTYQRLGTYHQDLWIANDFELMTRFLVRHRVRARYIPAVLVRMRLGGVSNRTVGGVIEQNRDIVRALRRNGLAPSPLAPLVKALVRVREYVAGAHR
ncbi:MAG: glycosyltransferase [Planctomycetes bacterium]|nr:glycosyltransferase [Planctomycetota bacterium]